MSKVVLPALVAPATRRFQPAPTAQARNAAAAPAEAELDELDGPRAEAADRDARTVDREGRNHRVQPRPVGEPRVDHRRRAIEPQPERGDDPFDEMHDRGRVEVEGHGLEPAPTFDVGASGSVDHHLGDRRVRQQGLQRAEPDDLVGELLQELLEARRGEQRLLVAEEVAEAGAHRVVAHDRVIVTALHDETAAHTLLERRIGCCRRCAGDGRDRHAAAPRPTETPVRCNRSAAGRASSSGSRAASTPASTARATAALTGTRARTGRSSTSDTSRADNERPCSSTSTAPAVRASAGACTARRSAR